MSKNIIHVEGYDAFKEAANINKEKTVFALFTGSIEENGSSWCPDCVAGRWNRRFVSWAFRSQPSSSFYLETVKHIFIILYLYTAKARVICQILNACTRLTMPNGALNSEYY